MDDAKVSAVYRKWGPLIHRHCARIVGDSRAEDLTQEVFLRLWRHKDRVHAPTDDPEKGWAIGWVYKVATNACLNHLRDHKRERLMADPEESPAASILATAGPEGVVAARARLERLLEGFDEQTRAIVIMVLGAGFTQKEAADALGISLRTVAYRLRSFRDSSEEALAADKRELERANDCSPDDNTLPAMGGCDG